MAGSLEGNDFYPDAIYRNTQREIHEEQTPLDASLGGQEERAGILKENNTLLAEVQENTERQKRVEYKTSSEVLWNKDSTLCYSC